MCSSMQDAGREKVALRNHANRQRSQAEALHTLMCQVVVVAAKNGYVVKAARLTNSVSPHDSAMKGQFGF